MSVVRGFRHNQRWAVTFCWNSFISSFKKTSLWEKNSFFYILVSGDYIILALFTSIIVQNDSFLLIKVDKKLKNSISERNIEKEAFDWTPMLFIWKAIFKDLDLELHKSKVIWKKISLKKYLMQILILCKFKTKIWQSLYKRWL